MSDIEFAGMASFAVFTGLVATGFFLGVLVAIFIGLSEGKFTEHKSFGYIIASIVLIVMGLTGLRLVGILSSDTLALFDNYISGIIYILGVIIYMLIGRWWKRRKI